MAVQAPGSWLDLSLLLPIGCTGVQSIAEARRVLLEGWA